MTKVCFINTNRDWGGGEKWHYEMAIKLHEAGHDVYMIVQHKSELEQRIQKTKIHSFSFHIGKFSFLNPYTYFKTLSFFRAHKFDSVIMNLPIDAKTFSITASKSGVKKVIYRRGMNHPIQSNIINNYIYKNFVTDIIANSEEVKRSIYKNIKDLKDKVHLIYNGVKTNKIQNKNLPTQEQILIGNLGRLVEQKGQHYLIELGKILQQRKVPYKIIIAGQGPLKKKLYTQIKESKQEQNIFLIGMTTPEVFFSQIDYFVFTSKFEGLSNALLEALQFRKPIICFDTSSNCEIVSNDINGYLIEPFDLSKMADTIIQLHHDRKQYSRLQDQGKEILLNKFDQNKMTKRLEELITP